MLVIFTTVLHTQQNHYGNNAVKPHNNLLIAKAEQLRMSRNFVIECYDYITLLLFEYFYIALGFQLIFLSNLISSENMYMLIFIFYLSILLFVLFLTAILEKYKTLYHFIILFNSLNE